jgi:branched-chain amino acid transport system permease protein
MERIRAVVGSSLITPQRLAMGLALFAALAYPWILTKPFPQHLMTVVFLYAMLGTAWNMLGGFAGQVSLGHAAYFGLGAYTSTLLLTKAGLSPWLGMFAGVVVALAIALPLGYASFRLGGRYFTMATIVIGEVVRIVFTSWSWVGGAVGIFLPILPESFVDFQFHSSKRPYYYIMLSLLLITMAVAYWVQKSRLGYYLKAIRDDPVAARSLGISVIKYKLSALALSVVFTAMAGTFYAQFVLFIDPVSTMPFLISLTIALVTILGGIGTLWGPVIGSFVLIPITQLTRVYLGGAARALDLVVYGPLVIFIAILQPDGLVPMFRRVQERLRHGALRSH